MAQALLMFVSSVNVCAKEQYKWWLKINWCWLWWIMTSSACITPHMHSKLNATCYGLFTVSCMVHVSVLETLLMKARYFIKCFTCLISIYRHTYIIYTCITIPRYIAARAFPDTCHDHMIRYPHRGTHTPHRYVYKKKHCIWAAIMPC